MKSILSIFLLLAVCIPNMGFANTKKWCEGLNYSIAGEYLYWRADRLEQYMPVNGNFISYFQPEYDSGARVIGAVGCNCWEFAARYTYYNSNNNQQRLGANDFLYQLRYHLNYQIVDLTFAYTFNLTPSCIKFKPFVGAKLGWLKETTDLVQLNTSKTKKFDTDAYGPTMGAEISWCIFNWCLPTSLIARAEFSALSARSTFAEPFVIVTIGNPFETRAPAYSFITIQDLYIGLGFSLCGFSCAKGELQVGYEVQNWTNLYTFVGVEHEQGHLDSLGLGGLVVHLSAHF